MIDTDQSIVVMRDIDPEYVPDWKRIAILEDNIVVGFCVTPPIF